MRERVIAVLLGDGDSELTAAVERTLGEGILSTVETPVETESHFEGVDCVVATSTERACALLAHVDDLAVPLIVVTDDANPASELTQHDRVRLHRADDLVTLESRIVDAVLADRERRQAGDTSTAITALTDSEVAYQTLVENIPNGGVALFDRGLRYTWVGGEVFSLVDLDPDDVVGKSLADVHSSAFIDAYADAYRSVFEGERSSIEFPYDGRFFQLDILPVREGDSVIAGMTMTRDITDDRERERDLLVKTRAMDAAAIGLCLTDPSQPDNPLVYVNEGYERMTGYDADEVLGQSPRHLQGPETEATSRALMREAVEQAESVAVDITNYRKDGTPFVNHVEITPIFDDEGALVHFLGSQVDVTEQHDRERSLARQNEQLEAFASVVSHELRSPLAVVQGRLQLAREMDDLSNLDRAEASLDRMAELIEDLLTLAREGRALDPTRVESVSLETVARRAWNTVVTSGATLEVEDGNGDGDELSVDADELRLQQLFENLFRNSVEHGSTGSRQKADESDEQESTRSQGADVEIRLGELSERCGFFVVDNGPGIPSEIRDRVFDAGVTMDEDGTGFGLAIVKSVADAHGWEVRLTEGGDGGARFEFGVRCHGNESD